MDGAAFLPPSDTFHWSSSRPGSIWTGRLDTQDAASNKDVLLSFTHNLVHFIYWKRDILLSWS